MTDKPFPDHWKRAADLRRAIADAFESEDCVSAYQEIVEAVCPDPYRDDQWERLHRIMEKIRAAVAMERMPPLPGRYRGHFEQRWLWVESEEAKAYMPSLKEPSNERPG